MGFLAYDLAVHLWAQVSFGRRRHAVWHAFLAGYRGVRALGAADLAAVELFVAMRHVWLMGEYAGQTLRWGSEALSAGWVEREVGFLLEWERERLAPGLLGGGPGPVGVAVVGGRWWRRGGSGRGFGVRGG